MTTSESIQNRDSTGRFVRGNRAAVKHAGYYFLAKGRLPQIRGVKRLRREMDRIRKELEETTPDLNAKKSLLINQIIRSHGFTCLFEMHCKKAGLLDPLMGKKGRLDFQKGFKTYISLLNVQKRAIMALGLDEKEAEETMTPFEIVKREEESEGQKEDEHHSSNP